ncbi:NADH-quinone oxidoreductase subunit F [Iamia sp. SCSIO 61187]|uniref:NADH-ubiquinone oxidoreductase-F iron-sulfur binding region domain-containing protein n=1 Tax=Iamia sp. SCSIO 61187 TaxID=2722752 RepID=UPI001C62D9F9|nr:NADH-ubiquinone oxidoreductase-F iron-sulfur binding region domain-containing protein [Iamia sp. SCSIO 61187]QYG91464.1 NADH-quinone oxidoreductase subunit F [Iamia sp. SCSIO 61187]
MSTFLLPPEPITSLDAYLATEHGGLGVETAQRIGPAATIEMIAASGLRGRGGGGFPTGRKWAGIAGQTARRRYLVVNGAEGEPGTFKDRALLRANPYQVVEGMVIAGFAIGAEEVFICLKASFEREIDAVTRAVQELQDAGICSDCTVTIVGGPDEYLFGEEKAMLEVIEGKPPLPRWFPPYEQGLFASSPQAGWEAGPHGADRRTDEPNPTLVNNVETLANVPHILARGADWFRTMGTDESPGTIVATVVGDVVAPDVGEVELGTPLGAAIDGVGSGIHPGRRIKAVFSGVANPVVTADQLDTPVSYEGFAAIGSGMGAAGFIVHDDTACMVGVAHQMSRFLAIESCGQCPPCKIGSGEITAHLARIEAGDGDDDDLAAIGGWLQRVTDGNRCYLPVQEQLVVSSVLRAFPEEFAEHVEQHRCPRPASRPFPRLVDLADGRATYDEAYARKRHDWTYAEP